MFAIKELDPHWKGGLECNWGRCGKPHSYGESGRSSVCVGVYGVCSMCAFLPCFVWDRIFPQVLPQSQVDA